MTDREQKFLNAYIGEARFNATKAARIAGYKDPEQEGWRVKNREDVRAAINEYLDTRAMSKGEVIAELSEIASMDLTDCITIPVDGLPFFDFRKARKLGKLNLVKRITPTEHGLSVELMDKQGALVQMGRVHGIFVDRQELTGKDGDALFDGATDELRRKLAALTSSTSEGELPTEPDGSGS